MSTKYFNPQHGTWRVVAAYLTNERKALLEDLLAAPDQTISDKLRGRILEIDEILNLPHRLDDWEPPISEY
jgi:hypothetical protein